MGLSYSEREIAGLLAGACRPTAMGLWYGDGMAANVLGPIVTGRTSGA